MRKILPIMDGWNFTYGKDNSTCKVNLPHTWNNIDGQDGGNDYYRGTCVYEKAFPMVEHEDDELVYLNFDGVNASCRVVLNGNEILTHDGGYSTFRVDVTSFLREKNRLIVFVDNSKNDRVYPQNADFTFYGGIYRLVSFIIVNKIHFNLDYFASSGLKCYSEVKDDQANVFVESYNNAENENSVLLEIIDRDGKVVGSKIGNSATFVLKTFHLWDGIKNPYLYTIRASILADSEKLDEVECKFGIRTFRVDPHKGFFLNGRSYPLHGVSRHQDRKALGNAISEEMMDEDIKYILEVGANSVRLAHYQHNQHFYDLCDKYGLVVWAEIPYISEHLVNGNENTLSQMKELIIQNYNHASIVTWGISNEITIKDKHRKDMLANHHRLQELCKTLDPTRPTSLACYAMCTPFHRVTRISDLVGWNLYLGWYVPCMWLNDAFIWFYKALNPSRCLCYSEYGAEGMPNLHAKHPRRGDNSEEYQCKYHEFMLKCFARHKSLWGTFVWNMYDFAADARNQGGEPGMNHKGLMTFDRKVKKDSFYLYKAYWSEEKFIHIAGKRYANREGRKTKIKVYSTLDTISLYNNGKLVATKKGNKVFNFTIKLEDTNELVAKSGNIEDKATLKHVRKKDPSYKVQKVDSTNWTKGA